MAITRMKRKDGTMQCRHRCLRGCLAFLVVLMTTTLVMAQDDIADLKRLGCVAIVAEPKEASEAFGISKEWLSNQLFVELKSKTPRLQISDSCPEFLYVLVDVIKLSESAYAASIHLYLSRRVTLNKTGTTTHGIVWQVVRMLLGPPSARERVAQAIQEMFVMLAADYYKAGNP